MRIKEVSVKNFRLLRDTSLSIDEESTVIVGRNNSGKTSLTELIRRLLGDSSPSFRLEDFSMPVHEDFWNAFSLKVNGNNDDDVRAALPAIEVLLRIEYNPEHPLGALSEFVIDLDPASTEALIRIKYQLVDGGIAQMFEGLEFGDEHKVQFYRELRERFHRLFRVALFAIDPTDSSNIKQLEWPRLQTLLKSGFINAQRGLDDETVKDRDVLGKILEILFANASSNTASEADRNIALELENAVKELQTGIEGDFSERLKNFIPALSLFGYPGLTDPGLSTETTLDVQRLLKNHTKIRYKGSQLVSLPEAYNGLGARNLIYMLFKLFEFFKEFQSNQSEPGIHLVFIEEPEAHLHPQMQEVFIRQLCEITRVFSEIYNGNNPWPVQFIISTHSSHIANEAPFSSIRYFLSGLIPDGTFRETRIKDLNIGLPPGPGREFLHKYMTLTRCDLLFADKAILIEGATERLILPIMIQKNDQDRPTEKCLASQFISTIEIGGAYAHIFISLVNFLELRTLIITDIDTTKANAAGNGYVKCMVSEGTRTSNACISSWFDVTDVASVILTGKSAAEKTKEGIHITYQIPEAENLACGRSFEGAFMLANAEKFGIVGENPIEIEGEIWDRTDGIKKTNFAIDYAVLDNEWNTPKYIRDGLDWLAEFVEDEAPVAEAEAAGNGEIAV